MKKLAIYAAILLLAVGGVGTGYYLSQSADMEPTDKLRIAMSTTPLSAPIIIARQLEIFKKHKIDVELMPFRGGHLCFEAMMTGQADLATSSESVVMFNSFERQDFRLLASFVESDNDLKLITYGTDEKPAITDLNHRKIGMVKASASEFFVDAFLIITGQHDLNIEKVYLPPQDLGPALIAGDVDAISVWEPFGYQLNRAHPDKIYQFPSKGTYNLSFNLVSTKQHAQSHYRQHVKVLKAIDEAQLFIAKYPLQAKQIISEYLKVPLNELEWTWSDYVFRLSLNNSLLSNLQTQGRWAVAREKTIALSVPDFRVLLNDKALRHVLESSKED
ncbi:ABC transporter substrate-binding protein [Shewanella colwelliana]|uniref:ABC transporter substrate-binding protein n=1 Tax=Shewanella colwelliana TaxID=23 RepID=UPI0022AEAF54|nr:ABC transporter substrate-binding protein [Shewanella colwelliana]MCZ4338657.1 ABC transporter substrate-binding protein [Shewanella colwelliana]